MNAFLMDVLDFGVHWLVQSSALLTVGLLGGWLLRNRGAAVRSVCFRVTLAAVLLSPAATLTWSYFGVGGWSFDIGNRGSEVVASEGELSAVVSGPRPPTVLDLGPEESLRSAKDPSTGPATSPAAMIGLTNRPEAGRADLDQKGVQDTSVIAPRGVGSAILGRFGLWMIPVAWAVISLILLARIAIAWQRVRRLLNGAVAVDRRTRALVVAAADRLCVAAPRALRSAFVHSPCLIGIRRPTILLPEAHGKSEAHVTVAIENTVAHEMAHVVRRDCLWNLIGSIGTAVLFFQPLMWIVRRSMDTAAEEVCDDHVVEGGVDRCDYAEQLVDLAEDFAPLSPLAVRMACRSSLAGRIRRILGSSRTLSLRAGWSAVVVSVGIGALGSLVTGLVGAPALAADEVVEAADFVIRGRVFDPEGRPVVGARVTAARPYSDPMVEHRFLSETISDEEGRFEVSYSRSQFNVDLVYREISNLVAIVASKSGFGPQWVRYSEVAGEEGIDLHLVHDDVPVRGRLIDLEGRPVEGVRMTVTSLYGAEGEDLSSWLDAIEAGEQPWVAIDKLNRSIFGYAIDTGDIVTDSEGRFEIHGLGRERKARVMFHSDQVAYSAEVVVTREMEPLKQHSMLGGGSSVHGAKCLFTAGPSREVRGIVRDADTGEPIPGVRIDSWSLAPGRGAGVQVLHTYSDDEGRFELHGMPKGSGNQILAVPADGVPYLMREFAVPNAPGLDPVAVDLALHRGVLIRGRVMDRSSGRPVPSASIHYLPYLDNEFAQAVPEFDDNGYAQGFQSRFQSKPDGTFVIVGLPGKAIIGADANAGYYMDGVGREHIPGMGDDGHFETYSNPIQAGVSWPKAMVEVEIPIDAVSTAVELALDSGASIQLSVLDEQGRPLEGVQVAGQHADDSRLRGSFPSQFDAINFSEDERRTMVLSHPDSKQGIVVRLSIDESQSTRQIVLKPWAGVKGRLLDADGDPITGASISLWVKPSEDFGKVLKGSVTDEEGRYVIENIPVGTSYVIDVGYSMAPTSISRDHTPEAGVMVDMGDTVIDPEEG